MSSTIANAKRIHKIIQVFSKYGFVELIAFFKKTQQDIPETTARFDKNQSLYTRIRLVIEELGPTFIKLGQAFANREDLLPKGLTLELQKLQDKAAFQPINITEILSEQLQIDINAHFLDINEVPIAAASIAQVYVATLHTQEKVVLKVKRPNATLIITQDLTIIKGLSKFMEKHFEFARKMNLTHAISAFEQAILQELSFISELKHIQRFRQIYQNNKKVNVPKPFEFYCTDDILCIAFIEGAKITDFDFMNQHQLDPKSIANIGLKSYLDQILKYGIFHADPHAGNIILKSDGTITFIDFGTIGIITNADKEHLENFIIYLISKNTKKIIDVLKEIAISYKIENEKQFQSDIEYILEQVNVKSLDNIDYKAILERFKTLVQDNEIVMPEYIYLLVRGIMLIESIGRTIYPEMDFMKAMQPYIITIFKKRVHPSYLIPEISKYLRTLHDLSRKVPQQVQNILEKAEQGSLRIKTEDTIAASKQKERWLQQLFAIFLFIGSMLTLAILQIASNNHLFTIGNVPILTTIAWIVLISSGVKCIWILIKKS